MTERAFVCLGSNVEPERNLPSGLAALRAFGRILAVSRAWGSEAVGPAGQPPFVNAAALVETDLEPLSIRAALRRVEADHGRVRTADRYAPRPLDLDLCLLGDRVVEEEGLVLPDPDVLDRAYLARVLAELDPAMPYPGRAETLGEIAARLSGGASLTPCPDLDAAIAAAASGRSTR